MSLFEEVDYPGLNKLQEPAVRMLKNYDLAKLRRLSEDERMEMWNEIEENQKKYEKTFVSKLDSDLVQSVSSKFSLSKLLLAAAADANKEDNPIIQKFSQKELSLVEDFERFRVFDNLSTEDAIDKITRKEGGFYELLAEYYEKQYSNLDKILESPDIQTDLLVAFRDKYLKRQRKIEEIISAGVKTRRIDPSRIRKDIEKTVMDRVRESEQKRGEIIRDAQMKIVELENKLKNYESLEAENLSLKDKFSQLDAKLVRKEIENEAAQKILSSLESDKNRLEQRYSELGGLLDNQLRSIEDKRNELDTKAAELERERQQYKAKTQEENQRIVENELEKIASLKNELQNKENTLLAEKREVELKKNEIAEKLNQITEVIEGKPIRFVARDDAKLYELNYIARFDTKMHGFPLKLYNPLEKKNYTITSWDSHYRFDSREEVFHGENINYAEIEAKNPLNSRSVYLVEEKRFKLFGDKIKRMAIEAVSYNHLKDYADYGFDTNRATLSEFLMLLSKSINNAEIGKYLHVIGIASPTGWDERVVQEIKSKEFAHNYVSRYVSVALVDSVTGEVYYNPTDDRIANFIDFFKPEFDREKVERVKKHVLEKFRLKDYAVFSDVLEETGEERAIVNKAFYDLEKEGKGRTRYIKEVGLVLEVGG